MKISNLRLNAVFVLKALIGFVLLAFLLFSNNNAILLVETLSNFNFYLIFFIVFNSFLMNLVSTYKWKLFLGNDVKFLKLFNFYLIGKFFNNFAPSTIGGDISRVYLLNEHLNSKSKSAASVFMERFTGLLAMLILGISFAFINIDKISDPIIGIPIVLMIIISSFFLLIIYIPKFASIIETPLRKIPFIGNKLIKFIIEIMKFKHHHKLNLKAMILSFVFHVQTSIAVYLCALAIGFYSDFLDIALITPIILLVVTIPISPGNIGWWEWAFSVLLTEAGAVASQGLAIALILRANTFFFSLIGGIIFIFEKKHK